MAGLDGSMAVFSHVFLQRRGHQRRPFGNRHGYLAGMLHQPVDQFLRARGLDAVRAEKRVAQVQRVLHERLAVQLWGPGGQGERVRALLAAGRTPYDVVDELAEHVAASMRARA